MTESTYRIQGATGEWEVVIGLEVHAQVTSQAKLFSGAATAFGAEPNTPASLPAAGNSFIAPQTFLPRTLPRDDPCSRKGDWPHIPG